METKNFNHNVIKLQKEINNISYNINKVRYKNHRTMSNIVEELKKLSNNQSLSNDQNETDNKIKIKHNINNDKLLISKNRLLMNNNKYNIEKNIVKLEENKNNKYINNVQYFNNKNNPINIQKFSKILKNNENNDDDILLTQNDLNSKKNILNNLKQYILVSKYNSNNKKKK